MGSDIIKARVSAVQGQWAGLEDQAALKARRLAEAQQLVTFRREADEVDAFIQARLPTAADTDVGKDLEHVEVLLKKLEDFANDLAANEPRVDAVNENAVQLIAEGHPETAGIQARQKVGEQAGRRVFARSPVCLPAGTNPQFLNPCWCKTTTPANPQVMGLDCCCLRR